MKASPSRGIVPLRGIIQLVGILAACMLVAPPAYSNDPPEPKTVIVVPETDAIIEQEESTFDFSGTAVAVDSTVVIVEWRNNGGEWNTATGTDHWSFTATGLQVGENLVEVRSRNTQGANSAIVSRTIIRSPNYGLFCEQAADIFEDGFYEYDLGFTGEAWFRYTAAADGLVTVQGTHHLEVRFCGDCDVSCGTTFNQNHWNTATRFVVYSGQQILLRATPLGASGTQGGFSLEFEPAEVQPQDSCATAREITDNGAYHFDMNNPRADLTNPCMQPPPPDLGKADRDYRTVWYRFTAPGHGFYNFSIRQNPQFIADADYVLNTTHASLHIFQEDPCPPTCSTVATLWSGSGAFEVFPETTFLMALTFYDHDEWYGAHNFPGYGILDVEFRPITQGESCDRAIEITENGIHEFSNVDALLDDPCRPNSPTQWFTFTAPGYGSVLVETCGLTTMDTYVSAFAGNCPLKCSDRLVFNDDAAGPCGLQSRIHFNVLPGQTYKIGISGFANIIGSGSFYFEYNTNLAPLVIGDIIGNGQVNVSDVTALANLIAAGTPPPLEMGDINGDGVVNHLDVQALAEIAVGNLPD